MSRNKPQSRNTAPHRHAAPPTVSGRWLLTAFAVVIPAAALCAWGVLCLLFWQGSWQLLYHPAGPVARTPAAISLPFDAIGFAATDTGEPQLQGWWIPAAGARYTVLYLHGQDGNLADTLDDLGAVHAAGANVFAFDYRGYGQSVFAHPSEARWRQDAESALQYLRGTRHIDAHSIVLEGSALGGNLALEAAAAHPELAGVVVESPIDRPMDTIFNDPRAHLVPARLLVSDRYDLYAPAAALRIPSLWFYATTQPGLAGLTPKPEAFQKAASPKNLVGLTPNRDRKKDISSTLSRWLSGLPNGERELPPCQFDDGFIC